MKKLLILISIFLFSCNSETITISKDEYRQLKGDTIKIEYPKYVTIDDKTWTITLGSDGHEWCDNNLGYGYICFHYIDCKLCKKRRDSL